VVFFSGHSPKDNAVPSIVRSVITMSRWLVQLNGERIDLEEFPRCFPDGDIFVIEEKATFFLVGSAFEFFRNAEHVLAMAIRVVDQFSAVISLSWPGLRKPEVGNVFREDEKGKRDTFVFLSAAVTMRSKLNGSLSPVPGLQASPPTQAQQLLARAGASQHLGVAISLWSGSGRSWSRLYRIMEEIEQHLGKRVDSEGLCSGNDRERFTRSANTAEVSGIGSRHASGKFSPPSNPMTLHEAASFVRGLLFDALRKP
jgi:hypothetical protein